MTNFTPRPTVYKGTKMRSRLEAGFAAWLDQSGLAWEYEPAAFATERGQYLPDFLIPDQQYLLAQHQVYVIPTYIDVKPAHFNDHATLFERMAVIQASEPSSCLIIVQPDQAAGYVARWLGPTDLAPNDPEDHAGVVWLAGLPRAIGVPTDAVPWAGDYWNYR